MKQPGLNRYNKIRAALLGMGVLLLLTACHRAPQLPPLTQDAVILAFGDSLTYGTGASAQESYPAVLEQLSGRRVVNAGIPGEVTAEGLARLPATLEEVRPQLLILCLGGNDMLRQQDLGVAARNLQQMVEISRGQGVPVVLLGVPRPALLSLESAPFYNELAERLQIPLEDEILAEVLSQRNLRSDQIHPNGAGYRLVAEALFAQLKQSGAL